MIGLSSHDVLDAAGNITGSFDNRLNAEPDPNANIEVSVRDATGTPLEGAILRLTIDDTAPPRTVERLLHAGEAARVGLELPPYFSYLLPTDAPGLPPCDPVNDTRVNVVLTARLNDYDSADSFTFDNCTYWHAVAASSGSAAMSFTLTFPRMPRRP